MFCVEGSKVQGVGCPQSVQVPWAIRGQPLLWPLFRCFAVLLSDQRTWLEPCLLFCRRGMDQWMDVATF